MIISDLPLDLESEILSKVPPKSLTQFRFTCKRWYALFNDPGFIKKNLSKQARQVILKRDRRVYSGSINLHGIHNGVDPFFEFTGKLKSLKGLEHVKICEISHCDGLLLCTTNDYRLVVCNPCTGQTRWIQPINRSIRSYYLKPRYVLGYENNNNPLGSYKILSFCVYNFPKDQKVTEVGIYEFNSDSWRVLGDDTSYGWYEWLELCGGVSLMGNTYCYCNRYEENHQVNYILMFDFTTERPKRLRAPYQSDSLVDNAVLSVVREEKLALLRFDKDSSEMRIWVTNTKIDTAKDLSWSDFLLVDFSNFLEITGMFSFLVDERNEMVVCCDKYARYDSDEQTIRIYIVGESMHKEVYKETTKRYRWWDSPLLLSYVPSLVHIQPATRGKRKR